MVSIAGNIISWYSHHSIYYEHIRKFHQQLPRSPFPPQQECSHPSCQQVHSACNLFPFQCCTEHITTHQWNFKTKNSLIPWLLPSFVLYQNSERSWKIWCGYDNHALSSRLLVTTWHSPFLYSRSMWQKDAEDPGNKATQRGSLAIRMLMLPACLLVTTLQTYSFPSMSFRTTVRPLVIRIAGSEENQGLGFHAASNRGGLGTRLIHTISFPCLVL